MLTTLFILILGALLFPSLMRLLGGICLLIVAYFVIAVSAAPAAEYDFPRFDPNGYCAIVGEREQALSHDIARKICLSREQSAYDEATKLWPLASDKTHTLCLAQARNDRFHFQKYQALDRCLAMLVPRDQLDAQGEFHY